MVPSWETDPIRHRSHRGPGGRTEAMMTMAKIDVAALEAAVAKRS
jgi:hypothetical protein